MITFKTSLALTLQVALSVTLASNDFSALKARGSERKKNVETSYTAIVRTPPAPVFSDGERQSELANRRERVARKVGAGNVLILMSSEPRVYTGDVDYEYRQENNFYYLTGIKQEHSTLVMMPYADGTKHSAILFVPRRNPQVETWTGKMIGASDAARISGITDIRDAREFAAFMKALGEGSEYVAPPESILNKANDTSAASEAMKKFVTARSTKSAKLFMLAPEARARNTAREFRYEARFADAWERDVKDFPIERAFPIFAELRMIKSPYEQRIMQHAIDITAEALGRAMGAAHKLKHEYEVEAEVEYTFKRRGADFWGYPSIVGCGANATTLHYWQSTDAVKSNDLLLMDVGAEYDHYTADVTRTFPVSGVFTKEQAEIYNIVLRAQDAAMKAINRHATFDDLNRAATKVIQQGLYELKLIPTPDAPEYRLFFMHGVSHWLGMNVHDVGLSGAAGKLAPGTVFTVEPGIYIRPDALDNLPDTPEANKFKTFARVAFERYKGIGVRIEDDVVMNETGFRVMSEKLPRTVTELERFIAAAQREVALSRFVAPNAKFEQMFLGDHARLAMILGK